MSLTRKMLKAYGIEDPIIEQIIEAHTETTDSLKAERDRYKQEAGKVEELQKQLDSAKDDTTLGDLQAKYEEQAKELEEAREATAKVQGEFDEYKAGVKAKETRSAKERAYRKLLAEVNVNPKYADVIVRATNLEDADIDESGEFKDAKAIKDKVLGEWSEFVMKKETKGMGPENPPEGDNVTKGANPLAVQIAKERHERLYGKSEE